MGEPNGGAGHDEIGIFLVYGLGETQAFVALPDRLLSGIFNPTTVVISA